MTPPIDPSSATGRSASPHHHRPPSPPESSPPQQPAPFRDSTTPLSPSVTSADLDSDPESISDVSSIPPSDEGEFGGARDLAASAWEDLGSSTHRSQDSYDQGDHSRRPSSSSYDYSSSGRSRDGDEESNVEETSADETSAGRRRTGRLSEEDDFDGLLATYIDLEPSLHSDPTLTDTSAENASRAGVAASTASLASSTNTTTHEGSPLRRATTSTLPSFEFSYPDPSTVASSFSSAQGSQHAFRRTTPTPTPTNTDGDGLPKLGTHVSSPAGGERPHPSYARGAARRLNSDGLTPSSSWIGASDSFFPAALKRSSSSPVVPISTGRASLHPNLAHVPEKAVSPATLLATPLLALPPRIQIIYLGLSPSQSYFDSLLRTLLNLLHASLPAGHEAVPALLKQYDLLGGTKSSKIVGDIREPFRKERRVSQGASTGVKRDICEIQVGDLTVEESDDPESINLIEAHLKTLAQSRPTTFLFLVFESALSPVESPSSSRPTRSLVDLVATTFPSNQHTIRFLPVVLPSGGGFGDYPAEKGALRIDEVLELRGPIGASTVCGLVLSDGVEMAGKEVVEEPIVEVKFNAARIKKEVPRYLRTVCAVPLVLAVAALALGFLPERFEPTSSWIPHSPPSVVDGSLLGSSPSVRARPSVSPLPVDEQTLAHLIKQVVGGARPSAEHVPVSSPHSASVSALPPTIEPAKPSSRSSTGSLSVRSTGEVAVPRAIAKAVSVFVDQVHPPGAPERPAPAATPSSSSTSAPKPVGEDAGVDVSTQSLAQVASGVLDELNASSSAIAPQTGWLPRQRLRLRRHNSTASIKLDAPAKSVTSRLNGTNELMLILKPKLASAEALATHFALDALDFIRSSTELVLSNLNNVYSSLVRDLAPLIGRIQGILRCLKQGSSSVASVAQHTVKRAQRGIRIEEDARRRALQALFGEASRRAEEGLARTARVVEDAGVVVVEAARVGVAKASKNLHEGGKVAIDETLRKSTRGLHRAVRDAKGLARGSKEDGPPPVSDKWAHAPRHFSHAQRKVLGQGKAKRTVDVQKAKIAKQDEMVGAGGRCRTRACAAGAL